MYSPVSHFFSRIFISVPLNTIISVALVLPAYWIVGLKPDGLSFVFFILVCIGVVFIFDGVLFLVTLIATNVDMAYAMGNFHQAMAILFCGVFIPIYAMPVVFRWIYYISPFSYAFGAVAVNQFADSADDWFLLVSGVALRNKWLNLLVMFGMGVFWRLIGLVVSVRLHDSKQGFQSMTGSETPVLVRGATIGVLGSPKPMEV